MLVDTLIDPLARKQGHGITNEMVRNKPTLQQGKPQVLHIIAGEQVVIYNATFDASFIPGGLRQAGELACAMRRFAEALGGPWRKLDAAARHAGTNGPVTPTARSWTLSRSAAAVVWLWLEEHRGRRR